MAGGGGSGGVRSAWAVSMQGESVLGIISGSTLTSSNNWLSGVQNPTHAQGDLDGDHDLDGDDLHLLFAQYGLALDMVSQPRRRPHLASRCSSHGEDQAASFPNLRPTKLRRAAYCR
jgi:hypothetical protein